jgi:hypothetical protein
MSELVIKEYKGTELILNTSGAVNATTLCKLFPKKQPSYWLKTNSTNELIEALAIDLGIISAAERSDDIPNDVKSRVLASNYYGLVDIRQGGANPYVQGTWLHPDLAVPFAMWLDPQFAIQVSRWVKELIENRYVSLAPDAANWQKFNQLKLNGVLANPRMEVDLARRLHSWMCLCGFTNMHIEHPILNILNREQRRFDFYRSTSKTVEAYELKKNPITGEDVIDAICKRGYFEILKLQAIPNKRAKLTFISPHKINPEVQRLSDTTNNQLAVTTLKELSEDYYFKARKRKWKHQITHLDRIKLDPYYTCLFNEL